MQSLISSLLLLVILATTVHCGKRECVTVKGNLKCQGNDAEQAHVKVSLWDENTLARDTLMDGGYTSKQGYFYLYGCSSDTVGDIDPELRIYHKCTSDGKAQELMHRIDASNIGKLFDAGSIDLKAIDKEKFKVSKYSGNDVHPVCKEED